MNIEMINETAIIKNSAGYEKKKFEVEGEVNVPDIKPDILSVINVSGRCFVNKKELLDNKLKVEGTLDIFVIYLSDDEKNSLHGINNTLNFVEYVDLPEITNDVFVSLKSRMGQIEYKVANTRKIEVKCPIFLEVDATKDVKIEIPTNVKENKNIEIRKEKNSFKTLQFCKSENINISENINLGAEAKPIGEILRTSMQIIGKDYKTSYSKILAKAEAVVKIIYIADDEENSIETFETKIPVMGFIDVDGLTDNMEINLEYGIRCFNVKTIYQDLKATTVQIDSDIELCAFVYNIINFEIINDIYCINKNINTEFNNIKILKNSINVSENVEINQSLLIPELDYLKILNIDANTIISEINILEGKLALEGNIEFNILYYRTDKNLLENKKMELPFQQVLKISELHSNMKPQIDISINEIEHRSVGGNQEQLKISLNINVLNNEEITLSVLKDVELINGEVRKMPSIVVYYVKENDTLWEIAKKFNVTVCEIKMLNNLQDDVIYPNQQLIIKRGVYSREEVLI